VPEPVAGINDVLIRVDRTGICGTDLHIYNWDAWAQNTIPVPMVVGHEFVGEVVGVGSNVTDFFPGDRPHHARRSPAGTAFRGGDARARRLCRRLFYPVVPQGRARIRTQIGAAHTREDLAFAVEKFAEVKAELDL
jgi:threonine dehydrogenase-like Zn-dependent dehydrogenase